MTENRRDEQDRGQDREASSTRQDDSPRDDLTRRREEQRQSHLTRREREERWPIG